MFSCPYCNKEIQVDNAVENVRHYGGTARVATPCCKKPIAVTRSMTFNIRPFTTSDTTDSWGQEYSKE